MEVGVRQELKGENVAWQTSGDQLRERELADPCIYSGWHTLAKCSIQTVFSSRAN